MSTRNTTLSALIRQGFETATTADAELPGLMHDPAVPLGRQDEVMAALIRCYRRSPHSGWSAVLLETLSPMVVAVGGTFAFVPDGISREDVDHQLIAEALYVARAFALPQSPRYMQRWLQRRLLRRMARWLAGC